MLLTFGFCSGIIELRILNYELRIANYEIQKI